MLKTTGNKFDKFGRMPIIAPWRLKLNNTVLVRNLGCYLPLMPIASAIFLALFSTHFGSQSFHNQVQVIKRDSAKIQLELITKQRWILIGQLFACLVASIVFAILISKDRKILTFLLKMKHPVSRGSFSGEVKVSEKNAELVLNYNAERTVSSVEDGDQVSEKESTLGSSETFTLIEHTQNILEQSVNSVHSSNTDVSSLVDESSLKTALQKTKDAENDSELTESSVNHLAYDDSGIGSIFIASSRSLEKPPDSARSESLSFDITNRANRRNSYVITERSRRSSAIDEDLLEDEEMETKISSNGDVIESQLLERKTRVAIDALKFSSQECRDIEKGLRFLRSRNENVKSRLQQMMIEIEEVDV